MGRCQNSQWSTPILHTSLVQFDLSDGSLFHPFDAVGRLISVDGVDHFNSGVGNLSVSNNRVMQMCGTTVVASPAGSTAPGLLLTVWNETTRAHLFTTVLSTTVPSFRAVDSGIYTNGTYIWVFAVGFLETKAYVVDFTTGALLQTQTLTAINRDRMTGELIVAGNAANTVQVGPFGEFDETLTQTQTPAITPDDVDRVYLSGSTYCCQANGKIYTTTKADLTTWTQVAVQADPLSGFDGTLYLINATAVGSQAPLVAYNLSGVQQWSVNYPTATYSPDGWWQIDADGTAFYMYQDPGRVSRILASNGSQSWESTFGTGITGIINSTKPRAEAKLDASNGRVIIHDYLGHGVFALATSDGSETWNVEPYIVADFAIKLLVPNATYGYAVVPRDRLTRNSPVPS